MIEDYGDVALEVYDNCLVISVDPLLEIDEDCDIWEVFEGVICNSGWELVSSCEIGALTDDTRFIFCSDVNRDDNGDLINTGNCYIYDLEYKYKDRTYIKPVIITERQEYIEPEKIIDDNYICSNNFFRWVIMIGK